MVFQNYALYPHLTVYRNMAFGLELREGLNGLDWIWRWALPARRKQRLLARRTAIADRVHDVAEVLGINHLLGRFPRQLSGGERQRVALGRAIVRNPAVFLFDEPLSNLDAKLRVETRRELKQLHGRLETTMIYVTHDQVEALTLGERIVVMNDGAIQQVGQPMEVYDWPANRFVAGFIGTPAMNFIEGTLQHEHGQPRFRRGRWTASLDGRVPSGQSAPNHADQQRTAVLGVRPEDVQLGPESSETLPAVVRLVEMLGDASVATLEISDETADARNSQHADGANYVLSKTGPHTDLQVGQRVGLSVDTNKLHVFDPTTGENWVRCPAAG